MAARFLALARPARFLKMTGADAVASAMVGGLEVVVSLWERAVMVLKACQVFRYVRLLTVQ